MLTETQKAKKCENCGANLVYEKREYNMTETTGKLCDTCYFNKGDGICGVDAEPLENIYAESCFTYERKKQISEGAAPGLPDLRSAHRNKQKG